MSAAVRSCPQCGSEYSAEIKFCPKDGTTLRVPSGASLIGTVIADRYHILKKLGEGGMGQVYLAEHVKMGRPSAIKVMSPAMVQDADAISRFNREASNASKISHPNVAAIYDFGETSDGLIYLAMEFVEGEPLTTLLARTGPLTPGRAASIVRQTAGALDAAHERGIIHRDLKPDNIMIARNRDGSDLVKVVDFGIAKAQGAAGQTVTKTGLVVGTPEYMSPEQLAGDDVDSRSDTFALALVAFYMLTGLLPYEEGSAQETMIRRLTDRPHTLAETRPGIPWPEPLERILAQALEREASRRPAAAGEFATSFSAATAGFEARGSDGATHVMSAIPATRVDDDAQTTIHKTPAPTQAVPARAPPPKGTRGWVVAGIGSAVAIGAAAVVISTRGSASAPPSRPADSAAVGTQQLSRPVDSIVHPAGAGARPPAPAPAPVPPSAATRSPRTTAVPDPAAAERARKEVQVAADLLLDDPDTLHARQTLTRIAAALPWLATRRDSLDAFVHTAEAYLAFGDPTSMARACDLLARVRLDPAGYSSDALRPLLSAGGCK